MGAKMKKSIKAASVAAASMLALTLGTGEASAASKGVECTRGSICTLSVSNYPGGKLTYKVDISGSQNISVRHTVTLNRSQKCTGLVKVRDQPRTATCSPLGRGTLKIHMPVYAGHTTSIVGSWYG
jgi:hypothetical protein